MRSIVHKIHRNYEPSLSDEVQSVLGVEAGRIFLFLWVLLRTLNVLHLLTMTAPAFGTLKFTRRLQQAGISVEQAEAQAEAINEALESQLATKIDILQLDKKIDDVASRLDKKIDGAVSGLDNKIDKSKAELKENIHQMDIKIAALKGDNILIKWMLGLILASTVIPLIQQFF